MSASRIVESRWAPWAGLFTGAVAWGAHHQIGSNLVYLRCTPIDSALVIALGAALLLATLAATLISWMSRRTGQPSTHAVEMRRFSAWISSAGGALFALAIVFQVAAAFMAPTCAP